MARASVPNVLLRLKRKMPTVSSTPAAKRIRLLPRRSARTPVMSVAIRKPKYAPNSMVPPRL
jgi:hypothetical protein